MIKDKAILFGYGTIIGKVSVIYRSLTLQYIQPPKEIGVDLDNEDLKDVAVLEEVVFDYGVDMVEFIKILNTINGTNTTATFRGYIFDFSNFNDKSVDVVKEYFERAVRAWQLALAC